MRALPDSAGRERPDLVDIPLPGFYPCLTWQMNVTWHQSQGLVKYVSVIREPNDHIEVRRAFSDLVDYADGCYSARNEATLALMAMRDMMGKTAPYLG